MPSTHRQNAQKTTHGREAKDRRGRVQRNSETASRILIVSHGDAMACIARSFGEGRTIDNCGGMLLGWQNGKLHWQQWID